MNIKGLTEQQVEESLKKNGSNALPESEPTTFVDEFIETFKDPMIKILLFITALMLGMFFLGYSEIYEPVGTLIAILIVATVTAQTGVASDSKYRELRGSVKKEQCKVYRDNTVLLVDVDNIVVGDKVLLQAGDKIPADGVLVDGRMTVNNSALNGETEECAKMAAENKFKMKELITGDTFVDKHSMFRGTVVFDGEGVMEVHRVGVKTMMGKMAEEMQEDEPDSPLKVKLTKLAGQISTFGYIGALAITILYTTYFITRAGGMELYLDLGFEVIIKDIVEAVSLAVVIIVCAVPEGLPLMISLVLMQNTSKMLAHNVLVRKAEGIETAGSLNILFSDKTGTITKGVLEVVTFFNGEGKEMSLESIKNYNTLDSSLQIAIGKNSSSMFDAEGNVVGGNSTDQALLKFLGQEKYKTLQDNSALDAKEFQTFNSTNKFSQVQIGGKTYYKGAPEKLLKSAKKYLGTDNKVHDINPEIIDKKVTEIANKAMRVLAFGYSEKILIEDQIRNDLVIVGFVGIRDDVRPEAREAIKDVLNAGVQVVMITGDRYETALAIARDAGLIENEDTKALTSQELNAMSDAEVKKIIPDLRVIARALPTDKSRMIRLCQEINLVVGMTGDGVNDSPALKRADVGFAMGSGTEAAKEASKIVILDDNFKSIKDAIWYGRTIYHNILKFCKFQLVINVAAVFVSAMAPFFGVDEPLKVTHLLFVNLVMDGLGAIMLGNEPAQKIYMKEKPRKRDDAIISKPMAVQIAVMGAWLTFISFFFLTSKFVRGLFNNEAEMLTAYFVLFIIAALFNGFNVRDDDFGIFDDLGANPGFMQVFFIIILVQFFIINAQIIPFAPFEWIGAMFSCVPFGIQGWICAVVFAVTMIPVDMLRKIITGPSTHNTVVAEGAVNDGKEEAKTVKSTKPPTIKK